MAELYELPATEKGTIQVSLDEGEALTGQKAQAILAANASAQVVLRSPQGVTAILPEGTLTGEADLPVQLPDLPEELAPGQTVVRVDEDGSRTPVPLSLVNETSVAFVAQGGGRYEIVDNAPQFTDAPKHWTRNAVAFATARGLVQGTGEDTFSPTVKADRATAVAALAHLSGEDFPEGLDGPWYDAYLDWAVEKGFSDGARPQDQVTRQEFICLLWRYAGAPKAETTALSGFSDQDAKVSRWAKDAMAWAVDEGIIAGRKSADGILLDPKGKVSRGELSVFLQRFVEYLLSEQYEPPEEIVATAE